MSANTGGYTPVPGAVVRECGPLAALVWGVVWRYCQMSGGVCWASQSTIGERADLSREAVRRHLRRLVQAGYLHDASRDAQGRAHTYADTGRAGSPLRDPALERLGHTKTGRASSPTPVGRVCSPAPEETPQDTPAVPPRAADDDPYDDRLYEQDDWPDEPLLVELLAEHFSRLTGIPQPTPLDESQLGEARALWADPLRRIAARCGSAALGRAVITAAVTMLRAKGCVVKAPIRIATAAEALAARQRASEASADR